MKNIFIICGASGSGKWTVVSYLKERLHASVFRPSDLTKDFLEELWISVNRENLSKTMHAMRRVFGNDIYFHSAVRFIHQHDTECSVFDGIRKLHFIEKLKKYSENTKIIFINSDLKTRYNRIRNRWEKSDETGMSFVEFQRQESLESEKELESIKSMSDILIENNWSIEKLYRNVDKTFNEFYKK